ncbi:hypothetical protein D7X33_14535 [Butyricicoccus sp. 1XD8-22]|nr:hypothetical protein D7X33_14535 [Butyricicoccus sp. 1XD8-22]
MPSAGSGPTRTAALRGQRSYADGGPTRAAALRGRRPYAGGARGTRPSGLPFTACGRDDGLGSPFLLCRPARQNGGGLGSWML